MRGETRLDSIDVRLLDLLQRDAALSQRDLADRLSISQNACWRRIRRLREAGVLQGTTARLDHRRVGLDLIVFMLVRSRNHNKQWSDAFIRRVRGIPEVIEVHRIGGEWDYLIKVVTAGMSGYDAVYQQLIADLEIEKVTGLFSMEQILEGRPIPVRVSDG
ncbi:Lrp/AsnC family transcriptional regulator [Rhodobacteraceae bacterium CCMM004]|nr:Lrp/AsnC family transcriptional regulator [Rhodobacteraceae bacterium CCMM004]